MKKSILCQRATVLKELEHQVKRLLQNPDGILLSVDWDDTIGSEDED